jgi:hypothetical protein
MGTNGGKIFENFLKIDLQLCCPGFVNVIFYIKRASYSRILRYWNLFVLVCFYRFFTFIVDLFVDFDRQGT